MKKKFLITSGGTGNAFSTCEAISKYFKEYINLIVTDTNPKELVSSSVFCDFFLKSPSIYESEYKEFLINLIHKHEITHCLPFIDLDISIFSNLLNEKKINNVYLQIKSEEISNICANKIETYKWLNLNKINTPVTYDLSVENTIVFDELVLKPKNGFGSKIRKVLRSEINDLINKNDFVVQEICAYPEITVDVFNDFDNDTCFILCRERIETKEGVCTKAKVFFDDKLKDLALKISTSLKLNFFCFQVMRLHEDWYVTDVNPRFGAGTSIGQVIGMDFYAAMIAKILNLEYKNYLKQFNGVAYVTRQYRNILSR